jgi:hypothetical protein
VGTKFRRALGFTLTHYPTWLVDRRHQSSVLA